MTLKNVYPRLTLDLGPFIVIDTFFLFYDTWFRNAHDYTHNFVDFYKAVNSVSHRMCGNWCIYIHTCRQIVSTTRFINQVCDYEFCTKDDFKKW